MLQRSYTESDYKNVLELREKGLGQRQISEKLNIPAGTVYCWYTGKRKPHKARTKEENMKSYSSRKHSPETIEKIRLSKIEELNPMWKGDKATEGTIRWRLQSARNPELLDLINDRIAVLYDLLCERTPT